MKNKLRKIAIGLSGFLFLGLLVYGIKSKGSGNKSDRKQPSIADQASAADSSMSDVPVPNSFPVPKAAADPVPASDPIRQAPAATQTPSASVAAIQSDPVSKPKPKVKHHTTRSSGD